MSSRLPTWSCPLCLQSYALVIHSYETSQVYIDRGLEYVVKMTCEACKVYMEVSKYQATPKQEKVQE